MLEPLLLSAYPRGVARVPRPVARDARTVAFRRESTLGPLFANGEMSSMVGSGAVVYKTVLTGPPVCIGAHACVRVFGGGGVCRGRARAVCCVRRGRYISRTCPA